MPSITLDDSPLDQMWVLAVMTFPSDQPLRDQEFAVSRVRAELLNSKPENLLRVDSATMQLVLEAPSYAELKRITAENTKKAIVAGNILTTLYVMDRFSIPEPSMNKAVFVAQQFAHNATYGDGTQLHQSERMVRDAWGQYRSVAHLWGALEMNKAYPFAPEREAFSPEHFGTFLSVAAALYEFGVSFVPARAKSKVPLLDSGTAWILPNEITPRHLSSARRPDLLEMTLKKYRANS